MAGNKFYMNIFLILAVIAVTATWALKVDMCNQECPRKFAKGCARKTTGDRRKILFANKCDLEVAICRNPSLEQVPLGECADVAVHTGRRRRLRYKGADKDLSSFYS